MDQEIRNKLRNVVTQCRKLLEDAITQELEGKYSIFAKKDQVTADPKAEMTNLTSPEDREARKDILDHYAHIKARGFKPKDALDQLIREIAFTHLNRLCAYKMMEAREVFVGGQKFREAVSRGVNSNGVKFYLAEHPEEERLFNTGHQDVAYRHFLDWLGGALSDEIGVLFNPNDPANRLYPRQKTLDDVLDLLNGGGIKAEETELREQWPLIWSQDETIGWVYQYFTPKELRDQARKESQAPRNSYELAFRNQFFTPRYVVEFLTDNTLGRIWYEMRKGDTKLKDQCRYMVRRPTEIFLKQGEQSPKDAADGKDDLSQEELLKLPVHIPHRPKKDPRELKILDPACGSGHFLLYCFDLLLTIYEEAYSDPDLGPALKKDYPTLDALKRDVPRLILAHNLHGIDIDLRASQIAALALWLRCQRAYQDMGFKKDRPQITRSNFVCAEPMPGEEQMLKEFVGQLEPKVLGQVVEVVFDKMKLAGEAGSLLKIEEEIRDAIREAKRQYAIGGISIQRTLFDKPTEPVAKVFSVKDITDAQFFEGAEAQVIEALRSYAEKAQNGQRLQRRLFSEDAVRGFAFIDLCQKRYDVVLMNPPFGAFSKSTKESIGTLYPCTKNDIYAAFVEQGLTRCAMDGMLGAITSRTGFFLTSFQRWREEVLLKDRFLTAYADLGHGVLDTAMVETAAYCVGKSGQRNDALFVRLMETDNKDNLLHESLSAATIGRCLPHVFLARPSSFSNVTGSPFAYWASDKTRLTFQRLPQLASEDREAWMGLASGHDFQWIRLFWEVPLNLHGRGANDSVAGRRWVPFAKGGGFSTFYGDLHLVVDWDGDGSRLSDWKLSQLSLGKITANNSKCWNRGKYFRPGLTWSARSQIGLSFRAMPSGGIFGNKGPSVFVKGDDANSLLPYLALVNSQAFRSLVSLQMAFGSFEVGVIQRTPVPRIDPQTGSRLAELALDCIRLKRVADHFSETSHFFVTPAGLAFLQGTLVEAYSSWQTSMSVNQSELAKNQQEINELCFALYGIEEVLPADGSQIDEDGGECDDDDETGDNDNGPSVRSVALDLVSFGMGAVFGRWDVRASGRYEAAQEEPCPFAPLPICSPGMLKAPDGRPASDTPQSYPIVIDWDGILVDDVTHHDDMVQRVRDVVEFVCNERAPAIEKEVCELLNVPELRDYFRKPGKGGFWDDHIARYSKSRRKAPIYWLLQSSKKNYAIWLYYHRLDKDLLFKALVNYVEPKIRLETSRLESLRSQKTAAGESGKEAKRLAKDVERQEEFLSELRDFEDKLRRAANLHLEPDLNDGVVLNIAPLWELVPWKVAKSYWDELLKGEYEWSSIGKQLRQKGLVK